jgi:hypothetical protein
LSQLGIQRLGRWALLIAVAGNPEHPALLVADELVEGGRAWSLYAASKARRAARSAASVTTWPMW